MKVGGIEIPVNRVRTVVIGSGCAGLNAADWLSALGETDLCLMTNGMDLGTSRNAGSDKQTYYKLSLSGSVPDSVTELAEALLSEGVNGDTALAEAAGSVQSFFKLVQLGVPFPTNRWGEFPGYQTDHDTRGRATSAGPLTSRLMTEALEREVRRRGVPIFDNALAFALLQHEGQAAGVLWLDLVTGQVRLTLCAHIVMATGGPACVYDVSVYPESQQGMTGMAVLAGARLANLHQWQYGLASVAFRWNVSGSYQQVLPRYVSVDAAGAEHDFLSEAFPDDPMEGVRLAFLKGYQWPFDVRKADASSRIDLLVQRETALGRRVYLDYRRNPAPLSPDLANLRGEARDYLAGSGALQATPIRRLLSMNVPAVELYRAHGIDLAREPLEIRVCAQHHNGGVAVDADWQTSIPGLYAVGEAAGTFGAYRPGGSALNSGQVGSMRAAQHIAWDSDRQPLSDPGCLTEQITRALDGLRFAGDLEALGREFRQGMSAWGAHCRRPEKLEALDSRMAAVLEAARGPLTALPADLERRVCLRDQLVTQRAVIHAMLTAAELYGSTGAGLVLEPDGSYRPHRDVPGSPVLYTLRQDGRFVTWAEAPRPMPDRESWFETVWQAYSRRTERKTGKQRGKDNVSGTI